MSITLIATTIMGFEAILAREIKALGFTNVKTLNTKVEFEAEVEDICKANLWLRTAGRVYVKMAQFHAETFDALYEQTKSLKWANWIPVDGQFPVSQVTSRKSTLFSKSDCQAIVKKAIAESLKRDHRCEVLSETGGNFPIRILIEHNEVILSMDTSGQGLNKRGYRARQDRAPLRETLAAGMVLLSRFRGDMDALIDPFCGTGTILIEAGLIAKNIAPGLNRSFNAQDWPIVGKAPWKTAITEAKDVIKKDASFRIYGSDIDSKVLRTANHNIKVAGLSDIFVQKRDIKDISSRFEKGKLITNPPYGERLADVSEVQALYRTMGQVFQNRFEGWSYYILTSHEDFEEHFGAESTKHRKLYNGGLKCFYYQYY